MIRRVDKSILQHVYVAYIGIVRSMTAFFFDNLILPLSLGISTFTLCTFRLKQSRTDRNVWMVLPWDSDSF